MIDAMPAEVRAEFRIGSAVRSYAQQAEIYRDTHLKYGSDAHGRAARPGHSQHEHGNAADLKMGPKAQAWAHRNAERFGLHFPLNGRNGTRNEPWHIEPIGARRVRLPGHAAIDADSEHEET